ncbi:hypothetical protein AAC387_Pa02g5040 [Persea americana]
MARSTVAPHLSSSIGTAAVHLYVYASLVTNVVILHSPRPDRIPVCYIRVLVMLAWTRVQPSLVSHKFTTVLFSVFTLVNRHAMGSQAWEMATWKLVVR